MGDSQCEQFDDDQHCGKGASVLQEVVLVVDITKEVERDEDPEGDVNDYVEADGEEGGRSVLVEHER